MAPRFRLYPLIATHSIAGLVLLAVIWLTILAGLHVDRAYHLRSSQSFAAILADMATQHIIATLLTIDKTSQSLRQIYRNDPNRFDPLRRGYDRLETSFEVTIADSAGWIAYSSHSSGLPRVNLRGQEYFDHHLTSPHDDLYISHRLNDPVSQAPSLLFTRKILDPRGEFRGIIILSVLHDYFVQFLQPAAIPPDGVALLVGADGWLRARANSLDLGAKPVSPSLFETPMQDTPFLDMARPGSGFYDMPASQEGGARMGVYRRLPTYPLTVLIFLSSQETANVSQDVLGPLVGGGLILSLLLVLGLLAGLKQVLKREAAMAGLIQREAQLRDLANNDVLTGIANRRYFLDRVEEEVARAHRYRRPFALAMLDLDRFKQINDTFGHAGGDAVLQESVRRIRARLRREDMIGRLGGEEFAIFLPETGIEDALTVLDLIRLLIAQTPFLLPDGQQTHVTVSIGVADIKIENQTPETLDRLLKRADEALYAAKRGGRNRVTFSVGSSPFSPLARQGFS